MKVNKNLVHYLGDITAVVHLCVHDQTSLALLPPPSIDLPFHLLLHNTLILPPLSRRPCGRRFMNKLGRSVTLIGDSNLRRFPPGAPEATPVIHAGAHPRRGRLGGPALTDLI